MKNKLFLIVVLLTGVFLISACSENAVDNPDTPRACTKEYMPVCGVDGVTYGNKCTAGDVAIVNEGECKNTQIANPASTFCVDNGGKLEIRTVQDGSQTGYCKINGQECEEWSLFRGECSNLHICTTEEKAAEICTMEYMPVCGKDDQTYGNKCGACSAKVDYWIVGECVK